MDERDESFRSERNRVDSHEITVEEAPRGLVEKEERDPALGGFFRETEAIQAAVRRRIEARTWEAFWLVGVVLWTVDETAHHLQMSHWSVFKAKERVTKMLQKEARRRGLLSDPSGPADHRNG